MTARDTERGRERQREIPGRRQRQGRERMKRTKTKRQRKRESTQPCTPSSSARFTQTLTLLGRRPAVRRKPLKSGQGPKGPRPGRVLAVGISPLRRREWSPPPAADLPPTYRRPTEATAFYSVFGLFHFSGFVAQDGSTWPNISRKKCPSWANMAPRWANIGSRWANIAPKLGQDNPKLGQHSPKMGQHSL